MIGNRPDLDYPIGICSKSLEKPNEEDKKSLKKIFKYIKGRIDLHITYKGNYKRGCAVYSDACLRNGLATYRSTSGVLCMYSGGAVSWKS